MQSFCQETEFALTEDVHNKLKKQHHNHHHTNRHNNHGGGGGGGGAGGSGSSSSSYQTGSTGLNSTTTAQGTTGPGGSAVATTASHNASHNATTHLQHQQQQELDQLLNNNLSSSSSPNYGHPFGGATPTIPTTTKASSAGDNDHRMVIAGGAAEKRSSSSLLCAKTPGRVKFNSIDYESLKESGGGGGAGDDRGGGGGVATAAGAEGRKGSSSGVSPSKKLKKSSAGGSSSSSSSSSSKHHHHHNHHHHHHNHHSQSSQQQQQQRTSSSSSTTSSSAAMDRQRGETKASEMTTPSATTGTVTSRDSGSGEGGAGGGANVGYNIFAKLRDLYIELKTETSPRKQSMNLLSTSYLLDKLVCRESLNTLVLNLYPGNKGYSLAFKVVVPGSSSGGGLSEAGGSSGSTIGSGGGTSATVGSNSGSSVRHRLQSGGAVPNTISSGSPSSHSNIINHNVNSPTSSSLSSCHFTPGTSNISNSSSTMANSSTDLNGHLHETMRWPYEEEELLACIDNEELPLMFVDLFERRCPQLFYSGCVIVEVRDYRQSFPVSTSCDKFHVLLRPTNQTLLADVQALTSEGEWSHEEKMALESQLILATAEPLCLDPSPQVGIASINGQHARRMFNTTPIRRHAKKFSQVAINRKRKTDQFTHHFGLELFDFMSRHRQRPRLSGVGVVASSSGGRSSGELAAGPTTPTTSLPSSFAGAARMKRVEIQPVRAPSLNLPETLAVPSGEVNVKRFARAFERPRETKDCMPQLVEEYVLETDRGNGRVNFIKLSILQRPSNGEYLGMLYLDRDYKEDERNGEACQFSLGTRAHANRYIQQFTEIFTEEGRKKVKITHLVPGQEPRITCTTGLWEQQQQQQSQQQNPQPQQQQQPQTIAPVPSQQSQAAQLQVDSRQSSQQAIQIPVQATSTPPSTVGGILTVGGLTGMEQGATVTQGQLLQLSKAGQQFSFQVHPQGQVTATATGGNIGINKLVAQQQQKPGTPTTVTLASPSGVTVTQQQQSSQGVPQTAQLLSSSQIKLLSNLGPNQFISFATTSTANVVQQTMDGGAIVSTAGGGLTTTQQQHHHPLQQQQPIQYAAIMNCDNSLLKNAISSGSQLGIRNGSLVLLQQNHNPSGKATGAVSLVQTTTTTPGQVVGGNQTTQMHVTLPQGLTQAGRPILQTGGVPVLQAQLVGVPMAQQTSQTVQQQQQQSPVQVQHATTAAAVVMSPPPPPQSPQILQSPSTGGSAAAGGGGGGIVPQQHHSMVQQTQAQLSTKQQNIHATNPAINALFTSLLASANQFEQQQAAAAAAAAAAASRSTTPTGSTQTSSTSAATTPPSKGQSTSSNSASNSTIINLLNSAPAAMTNKSGTVTPTPSTPGPPTLVNAFSGLVSPPPSSASSSQYGNSPATPVTGTTNMATVGGGADLDNTHHQQQQLTHHHQHHQQQQQHHHIHVQQAKQLTKQQMNRLLNGGGGGSGGSGSGAEMSPGLSSPSPSEGSGTEQQTSQPHMQSVRVTMSALASQLASPPAIMTNSLIQTNKHSAAAAAAAAVKVNLAAGHQSVQPVYGLNGLHQGATVVQQQQQQTRLNSPGSDSNHSTTSSFSLSMPTLNNLLAAGSGTLPREVIGGPGSVGATSSNGGNSMPPSPSPGAATAKMAQSPAGNILTIHASPSNSGGGVGGGGGIGVGAGCLISNSLTATSNATNVVGGVNNSVANALNNNNSMLIDRLTAMANSGGGQATIVNANSHAGAVSSAAILQKLAANSGNPSQQQQQQFTIPVASPKGVGAGTTTAVLQNIQLPVVGGSVSPQTGATILQAQTAGSGATNSGSTTTTLNLQGLNLASLQGAMATIPGLQNVQVQIPGLAHTISLSLSNNPGGAPSVTANSQPTAGLLVSVPVSQAAGGGQQMITTGGGGVGGGQQTVVLTNPGGGQFAQLVTSTAGLKAQHQQQQHGQKHLVATSVASGVTTGQGTPIQLVGLQMNPGTRNITATVSAASQQHPQQTATILNATPKMPVHRLSCPQLVRTLSGGGATGTVGGGGGTTLKLTQTGGLQVQGGNATTGGIFVNQSSGLNSILMTSQQLQALQKQQQQAVAALGSQQQQQMQSQVVVQQSQQSSVQAKATTKHGK